jgi:hypothetical protein
VLQEAAHELMAGDAAGPPSVRFTMLVTNDDALVVKADDARVGDGDTEDIAREVFQHGLLALSPDRAMDDPWPGPRGLRQNQVGTALLERGPELAAEEFGQGLSRDEEGVARWMPVVTVIGDAASGDQAVDVGVKEKLLGPRMQDGKHTDRAADMAWVASEFDDGLRGGLHQDGVAITLVGAQDLPQFLGHGHGDMEVAGRQHLGLARLKPALGLVSMAFGTTPILAGVIREDLGGALVAAPEMSAESLGAAGKDIGDGALMGWRHRRAMGRQVVAREAAEDVRHLDHDGAAASEAGHQSIKDLSQRNAGWLGQVGIDGGGGDVRVTEQNLNDPGINAIFQQTGRITVAQDVRRHPLFDAGGGARVSEGEAQSRRVGWSGTVSIEEQPTWVAVGQPKVTQIAQKRPRQRHKSLLVSLANDTQQHIGAVDRADFQGRGLAYA